MRGHITTNDSPSTMRHLTQKPMPSKSCSSLFRVKWIYHTWLASSQIGGSRKQQSTKPKNINRWADRLAYFTFSCLAGLVYSAPFSAHVISDEAVDDISPLLFGPLWKLFAATGWFLWGSGAGGLTPSSANFLRRFMTVGRNLVDSERSPGSWKHKQSSIKSITFRYRIESVTTYFHHF